MNFSELQIMEMLFEQMVDGKSVNSICTEWGFSKTKFYNWRGEYIYNGLGIKGIAGCLNQNEIDLITKKIIKLKNQTKKQKKLELDILDLLKTLDSNKDGEIDLIENPFFNLLSKNQKNIIGIDKHYIHQFVKISNYTKSKKQNIQKIYESIIETSSKNELNERVMLLKNQIHSYELLVFHSINMIVAIESEDLISFYEIYESFDKIGIFNSNWENEVSQKLTNIDSKLDDLLFSIYKMEQKIVDELSQLNYITQESFDQLNRSVINQLKEVESSMNVNNLLTGIQTYQLYKINTNTKSLNT